MKKNNANNKQSNENKNCKGNKSKQNDNQSENCR